MASNTSCPPNEVLIGDIVKQGYLWVKRPPRSYWNKIKAWHKRYFVLRDSFMDNTSILEMHNCQHNIKSNCSPLLTLELNETVHIGIASESHRFSNVLVLVCNGRAPLLLAADDELAARSWLLALDLTAQSRNTESGLLSSLPTATKFIWNNNSLSHNSICSTQSANNDHNNHHNHQNSESDSSTNGSACSCAPAFVRESSGFSDPTHGLSRSNGSSEERIPDDLLWTTDWHQSTALEPGLVLERFQVYVLSTDASERACLRGQLQLVIFTRGVGVARIGDFECFLLWPIAFIRQYRHESVKNKNCSLILTQTNKCDKRQTVVTLEVGRRCSTGEGIFSFRTSNGHEIMRQLKRAITNWAQYKANCRSNSRQSCFSAGGSTSTQRSRYSRSRSSAPCTPNVTKMLEMGTVSSRTTTPSPRKTLKNRRQEKIDCEAPTAPKLSKEKSISLNDDVNYVIPIFDDNEDEDQEKGSDYYNSKTKTYENCRQKIKINSRRNSCNTTSRTNSSSFEDNNTSNDDKSKARPTSETADSNPYLELIPT